MPEPQPPLSAAVLWGINALVWTAMGLLNAAHAYVAWPAKGFDMTVGMALESGMVASLGWFLLTPAFYLLIQRLQPGPGRWGRTAAALAVAVPVALTVHPLIHISFDICASALRTKELHPLEHLREISIASSWFNLLNALGVSAALIAARSIREAQERALSAARLETALGEARLEALRLQLNPHFLFNTLNSISALVSVDPDAAERMIARLGDLLRVTLASQQGGEVPLAQELEVLELYLDIERVRFGDRLTVSVDPEPGTEILAVPAFILQPIVENALRHGVASRAGPARVALRAARRGDTLELCVRDDGPGLNGLDPEQISLGVGLSNVRQRLATLYGEAGRLELAEDTPRGTRVTLTLPARRAA
ncbi:MAG: histidine kinase [Alphaproteobacteria bacterium]|nr:histidine kinase [Alphaproteobacteria bacterium]